MKKIILIFFLIFVTILGVNAQDFQKNNERLEFYYIRAREFKNPSKYVRTDAGKALVNVINSAEKTIDFAQTL